MDVWSILSFQILGFLGDLQFYFLTKWNVPVIAGLTIVTMVYEQQRGNILQTKYTARFPVGDLIMYASFWLH